MIPQRVELEPTPTLDGWADLFASCERSAVHLETRDVYAVDDEDEEFAAWKAGHRDDPANPASWWRPWLDLIAATTKRGVRVRRARVVSEPVTEYIRFEYDGTFTNAVAGERVRWLSRSNASDLLLPGNDFWLFDNHLVQFNHFTGDGEWVGVEHRHEPSVIDGCASAFEAVWARAVPHDEFKPA